MNTLPKHLTFNVFSDVQQLLLGKIKFVGAREAVVSMKEPAEKTN